MRTIPIVRCGLLTLLALLTGLSPSFALAQTRVGVIVVGPDSSAVAATQKALETAIAGPSVTVRGASDFAPVIGGPAAASANAWSNDPTARAAFDAALSDAKKSYFSDLMPQAIAKLDEAEAIVENALDVPGSIRVRVPLWRAAVALRQNKKDAAVGEVNVALLLVPNLEPEPNSPPPVVKLLGELRAKSPKPFKVQLNGVPANAVVKVDDVVFAVGSIAVLPGSHVLDVIAPGFRPFNETFDATADSAVNVALAPSIASTWEKLFEGIVVRGNVTETEKKSIESLAAREKLDFLVIAAVKPEEIRSAVWGRADGRVQTSAAPDVATIAAWASRQLTSTSVVVATPKPTPTPVVVAVATPTPVAISVATPTLPVTPVPTPVSTLVPGTSARSLAAEAGVAYVRWNRAIEPAGSGAGYTVPGLTGAGPRLRLHGSRRALIGDLEVAYFSFGTMKTNDPDRVPVDVPGGSMVSARLGAGRRQTLGKRDERSPAIIAMVGGFYESYAAKDLAGSNGVFPSHSRGGLDLRLGATFFAGPVLLLVEGGVAPFSTWKEDPDGATGEDPKPGAARLRFGADLPVGGKGRLALDYSGEFRKVTYSGVGGSALAPEKATRTEVLGVVGLSFRYRF